MEECKPCENIKTYTIDEQNNLITWIYIYLQYSVDDTNCTLTSSQYENAYYTSQDISYIPLYTWLEESFLCSGLCTAQNFFMFSHVNLGMPNGACYQLLNA